MTKKISLYKDYFKNHSYNDAKVEFQTFANVYELNIGKEDISVKSDVLEIGTGQGNFAYFCQKKGVKNYTGVEIDPEMTKMTQEIFPDYFISCADVIVFLKQTDKKYDYIFSAHVFEHFSIDDGIILADLIYSHLKDGGKWINIMPNASNFMAGYGRYNDITHKVLYTENSFTQSLTYAGFSKEKIEHRNAKFQRRWWVVYVQKLVSRIFSYVCILLDIPLQRIYTFEIYSIITK